MIDEAVGKILGMAMAYGASALGMFVAYVNYRKRIVKADKVMSPAAWGVIALSVLAIGVAVFIVFQIAEAPPEPVEAAEVAAPEPTAPTTVAAPREARASWSWVGVLIPASIFLFATWITAGLHRHFTSHGHGQ